MFFVLFFFCPTEACSANVTGCRQVYFDELDFTLWPVFNQFGSGPGSGHCLGHLCERQNHYNKKTADVMNSGAVMPHSLKLDTAWYSDSLACK